MAQYEWLLFDLDGTLSDPAEGFVNCMNHALVFHDQAPRSTKELTSYIGPPLEHTVSELTGSADHAFVRSMVDKYRERYGDTGYAENTLYPGIQQMLESLRENKSVRLGVCTSKRADFATRILEQFNLLPYFEFVSGGDVGIGKWQQLEKLLAENTISRNTLMIGDRHFDLNAAHKNQLKSAGVLWGYGSREELQEHQPAYLFTHPQEIGEQFCQA
ncbi:HAD family hydrolase [Microbulbifer agarilyticus]|uniref:HAD family hydrolase n=1 Tax=Microbulbifer agarilyticus TaxID=260552 RepID=UPI001CD19E9D|nr:HAD hydrolase-like protein [Microbulbifer agarilyticus]MCA0900709.1 HAD hydrolase-like protein [Microbulbifer agarilyticus]